jgi:hypothetical protein
VPQYRFTVINDGEVDLTDVVIVDPQLGTLDEFVIGTLTAGDQEVVQAPGAVQDEAGWMASNTAHATGKSGAQVVTSEPDVAYYQTSPFLPAVQIEKLIYYNGLFSVSGVSSSLGSTLLGRLR